MRSLGMNEAAEFLRVSTDSVSALAASGVLPAAKIAKEWVFSDEALENFLRDEIEKQTHARRTQSGCSSPVASIKTGALRAATAVSRTSRRRPAPPPALS